MRSEAFERRLEDARAFGRACSGLADRSPELSARSGLTGVQAFGLVLLIVGTGAAFVYWPRIAGDVLTDAMAAIFSLIVVLRLAAAMSALLAKKEGPQVDIADDELPVLTLLVPLLREGIDVVQPLIAALGKLNYPRAKLDVKFLLEADDEPTIAAVLASNPPSWIELIPVPPGEPRTKPKALNLGLASARGEIIAVFDAEDRPSPDQPREAALAFRTGPKTLAVVQAPLLIHNGRENWIARQFEAEYAILFTVWLPFLARAGLPLPLGGTSNYFRRDRLEQAGGWDAWNVTEDADLGLRLARFGGKAQTLHLPTLEESPVRFGAWLAQRTRWMKGHIQTWFVLMRQPFRAAREMGVLSFLSVQLTLGGSLLAASMHGPLLLWMMAGVVAHWVSIESWHAALLGVGYISVVLCAVAARPPNLTPRTLAMLVLYWPLLSFAVLCAVLELGNRPHFWAKTRHGADARKGRAASASAAPVEALERAVAGSPGRRRPRPRRSGDRPASEASAAGRPRVSRP